MTDPMDTEKAALENLCAIIRDRVETLVRRKKARDSGPAICAVVVVCPTCQDKPIIAVSRGLDGSAACRCGRRFMAGWDAEGVLAAYPADIREDAARGTA